MCLLLTSDSASDIQREELRNQTLSLPHMRKEYDHSTGTWSVEWDRAGMHDHALSNALIRFLRSQKALSISDFGCGSGLYVQDLRRAGFFATGYDGNLHTQSVSNGRCSIANLAQQMDVEPSDWTMALEVAEHIPKMHEHTMMTNIISHALCGVILSWGNQAGRGHVNCKSQDDVVDLMVSRYGLIFDKEASTWLKRESTKFWFRNNLQVFRKKQLTASRERKHNQRGNYPLKNGTCVVSLKYQV